VSSAFAHAPLFHPIPAGRQLPHLRKLAASMCLLENEHGLRGLVVCAPHIEEIDLSVGTLVHGQVA
jgi:hypothetical protein